MARSRNVRGVFAPEQENRYVSIRMWKRIGAMLVALFPIFPAGAQPLQKLVFATDWLAQAEHGGFYQAIAERTYLKYGLEVQIRMGGPQVNGLQLLAAGQIDIAMADALQVLSAVEQKVPVVAFAATFQKNPTVIISHPGVNRLEDLKGKPVAIAAAGNTTFWPWLRQKYFVEKEGHWRISDDVKRHVVFTHLNLLDRARIALLGTMDVILCRNVIIYFDMETKARVIRTFEEKLRPGGYLLLGHSESLINITNAFELCHLRNDMVYRRPSEADPWHETAERTLLAIDRREAPR